MKELYFDNNASTKPSKQVRQALWEQRELFGNPSSSYRMGRVAKEQVELARQNVASLLNAEPENIFFTSNNLALKGYLNSLHRHAGQLITSSIEHPSVLEVMEYYRAKFGYQVEHLPVDREGIVMPEALKARLGRNTKMISIMTANNETGSIQPISEFCGLAQERGIFFHTDAVQAVGKIEIDVKALGVDALSLSGHKLNAPKGIGALYLKTPEKLTPLLHGGKQEKGLRCGTENLMGIIGLGVACAEKQAKMQTDLARLKQLRERILARLPQCKRNGPVDLDKAMPNTLNLQCAGVRGELLVGYLDQIYSIALSMGSACSANQQKDLSHVLLQMGLSDLEIRSSVRISMGDDTTEDMVDKLCLALTEAIDKFSQLLPAQRQKKSDLEQFNAVSS